MEIKRFGKVVALCALVLTLAVCGGILTDTARAGTVNDGGYWGENLTWTYEVDSKTLYVNGRGPMFEPENIYDYPWGQYGLEVKKVIFDDNITTIGRNAFSSFGAMTDLHLPHRLESIGDSAFSSCGNLQNVSMNCGSYPMLYSIGNYAFYDCLDLYLDHLPPSLTYVGACAFGNTRMDGFGYAGGWLGENGGLTWSILFDTLYVGGNDVMESFLGNEAPWMDLSEYVTSIVISPGVTNVGEYAFYGMKELIGVSIPETVKVIGSGAFEYCSSLMSVTLPYGLKSIEYAAFAECCKLSVVTLPATVEEIGASAFSGTALRRVTLPASVKEASGAFEYCCALTAIRMPKANGYYCADGGVLFSADKKTLVAFPAGKSGTYAVPASVKTIRANAFSGCNKLTAVTIPNGVETIEEYAFYDSGLKSVTIPGSVKKVCQRAFEYCDCLTTVLIENGVKGIDTLAFACCSDLRHIVLPSSVSEIGTDAFKEVYAYVYVPSGWNTGIASNGGGTLQWKTDTGWLTLGTKTIYLDPTVGGVKLGWLKVSGSWYYTGADGVKKTGWQSVDGKWYYLNADGAMLTGWQKVNGKWYYLDSEMKTGWQQVNGKWYYLNTEMKTGWLNFGGKRYYLGTDGAKRTGWANVSGSWYYLGADGVMLTGWQQVSGKWYYLGTDGRMLTGWQQVSGKWYYLNSEMKTGWQQVNGKWYYLGTDGRMLTGWQKVNGVWYYLESSGAMKTGWYQENGKWYYLKKSGAMACGETLTIDGKSYSFNSAGVWIS